MAVGIIYYRVCSAFLSKFSTSTIATSRSKRKLARRKKTNLMLILVSLVFFFSWAPVNIYNLVLDIAKPFKVTNHLSLFS